MFVTKLFRGLAWKITFPIALIILTTFLGLGWYTTQLTLMRLRNQARETRDTKIKNLAELFGEKRKNAASDRDFAARLQNETILTQGFTVFLDAENNVLAKSANTPPDILSQILANQSQTSFGDWQVAIAPVANNGGKIIGTYSDNDQQILNQLADLQTSIFNTAPLIALIISLLVFLIVVRFTLRLRKTVMIADAVSNGDLSVEVEVNSHDEIGKLQEAMKKMVKSLREKASALNQISEGNLNVQFKPHSKNDQFGLALYQMTQKLPQLVQSQEERDQLQSSIMKLLNEVADVANGDLTAQAEVTPDATGAIADAFNYMITELRAVIERVMLASSEVGYSANKIRLTAERLTEGSEVQYEQISSATAAIEDMVASIQNVSQNAVLSARVAGESLANAKHGAQAVQNNINAMNRIRQQVQETAKRIKRLGERSQEIGDIVKLIEDIADRTSTLALNASLQAASAGAAGRGFVVVAEEVERLSERATIATKQIASLTKSIQTETKEVVASMEDTIQEVVGGSALANEAGQALKEIEQVSQRLAELLDIISHSAEQQARGSQEIARSMTDISKITELVTGETKQTETSVGELVNLVNNLGSSVSTFKLPENKKSKINFTAPVVTNKNGAYLN